MNNPNELIDDWVIPVILGRVFSAKVSEENMTEKIFIYLEQFIMATLIFLTGIAVMEV